MRIGRYVEEEGVFTIQLTETVEKAIERIDCEVQNDTGVSIANYLRHVAENYEYDDEQKASSMTIIKGLYNEADRFIECMNAVDADSFFVEEALNA